MANVFCRGLELMVLPADGSSTCAGKSLSALAPVSLLGQLLWNYY